MSSLDAVTEAFEAPQLLTVDEAARLLRIGRSRAYELANEYLGSGGTTGIPCFALGRVVCASLVGRSSSWPRRDA